MMRLFLFNSDLPYDIGDIADRCKVTAPTARREVKILEKTGFLKKKAFTKEIIMKPRKSTAKKYKAKTKAKPKPRAKRANNYNKRTSAQHPELEGVKAELLTRILGQWQDADAMDDEIRYSQRARFLMRETMSMEDVDF